MAQLFKFRCFHPFLLCDLLQMDLFEIDVGFYECLQQHCFFVFSIVFFSQPFVFFSEEKLLDLTEFFSLNAIVARVDKVIQKNNSND